MGIIYKIERDNKKLEELINWLQDNKSEIKDFMFGVRLCSGDIHLHCDEIPLEFMCTLSKMLDVRIDETIIGDSLTLEEEFEIELDE